MRSAVFFLTASLVAACNAPSSPDASPVSSTPTPESPAAAGPSPEVRIPESLLGTYDTDAAACAQGMTSARLTVAPDTLDFYYGYAVVDAVASSGGGYDVGTTLYQTEGVVEVVPEPVSYRLQQAGDGLRLASDYGGSLTLVRCRAAGGSSANASGTAGSEAAESGVESVYSEITGCDTIETSEEGAGAVQRCPGGRGVPLYVSLGDLRYDVDAGVRNGRFETPSGFNTLGRTVEWRVRDGRPFAVIVRYGTDGPDGTAAGRRSDLAVVKVGREGAPGCLVGYVAADASPDQNTAARRLADREAGGYDCGG